MPTETDLINQLQSYGAWLEDELGTDLGCASSAITVMDVAPAVRGAEELSTDEVVSSSQRGTSRLAAAVSALIVVGGIALLSTRSSDPIAVEPVAVIEETPSTTERQPQRSTPEGQSTGSVRAEAVDTPPPLYLLPASLDGFRSLDNEMSELPSGDTGSALVVGRVEANGLSDVSAIAFVEEPSFGSGQEQIEIDGRTVYIADYSFDGPAAIGVPVEGGGWLEINAATDELRATLLAAAAVENGEIVFTPFEGIEVISRVGQLEAIRTRFLSLSGVLDVDAVTVIVQAHPGDTILGGFGGRGDLEQIEIRGRVAYLKTFVTEIGIPVAVVSWVEEPGQLVTVSTSGSLDPVELAEGLRVLDEATWSEELEALDVVDSIDSAVGYPIGSFALIDENGADVVFDPDGSPVVLLAGSCAECLVDVGELSERVEAANSRFAVVRRDAEAGEPAPSGWIGPLYSLPDELAANPPFNLASSLDSEHLLILDGENTTVLRLDLSQPGALERLELLLGSLS